MEFERSLCVATVFTLSMEILDVEATVVSHENVVRSELSWFMAKGSTRFVPACESEIKSREGTVLVLEFATTLHRETFRTVFIVLE